MDPEDDTRKIGEILVHRGYLTWEQLDHALEAQRDDETRRLLGKILVEKGYITHSDLLQALPLQKIHPHLHGARVLVVEDVTSMRRMLKTLLMKRRADVVEAENGAVALEALKLAAQMNAPFDLVLLDLMMPKMDGLEMLLRVRSAGTLRPTPVIVLTARSDRNSVLECAQLGVLDYLVKPFRPFELLEHIEHCLAAVEKGEETPGCGRPDACAQCEVPDLIGSLRRKPDFTARDRLILDLVEKIEQHCPHCLEGTARRRASAPLSHN